MPFELPAKTTWNLFEVEEGKMCIAGTRERERKEPDRNSKKNINM